MTMMDGIHGRFVLDRRVRVLAAHLAPLLPRNGRVLDVGAGDGHVAAAIRAMRSDVEIIGIDTLVRPDAQIVVEAFDGASIPFGDASVDAVMFVDVLHHTADPEILLREARRVTNDVVIIKDHRREGFLARRTLRFMDTVGNKRHGVVLPYNYLSTREWRQIFDSVGLELETESTRLDLYPWPATWVFDRSLHFVGRLTASRDDGSAASMEASP